jgi:predicted lipoprotein with Yx(FWY)xxD motif
MRRLPMIAMIAGVALCAGLALPAAADEDYGPLKVQKTANGEVLADSKGMTVYTYDKDMAGKSACMGECAEYWPPVKASADAKATGDLTVISRDDGSKQWADHGKPLYTFVKDKQPGDMVGDNFKGIWHIVKPE